jgi:hypothetical protein
VQRLGSSGRSWHRLGRVIPQVQCALIERIAFDPNHTLKQVITVIQMACAANDFGGDRDRRRPSVDVQELRPDLTHMRAVEDRRRDAFKMEDVDQDVAAQFP